MATIQTPAIEIGDLHFAYRGEPIFTGANLTVQRKEFAAIVGPNGGGKTTLLRLLLGLLKYESGTIRVLGRSPEQARTAIGYIPQQSELDLDFPITAMEVVLAGCLSEHRWFGPYSKRNKRAALDALAEVGLAELAGRSPVTLSGGQQRRVLIARALVGTPELLLLDEPTANLDPVAEQELYALLRKLNERLTVVVVSHDLSFVSEFVRTAVCVNRNIVVHPIGDVPGELIGNIMGAGKRIVRHDHIHIAHDKDDPA